MNLRPIRVILLVWIILWLTGCGSDETSRDDLAPVKPQWIPRTGDHILAQRGIRAEPSFSSASSTPEYSVRLEWYANPEDDLAGYRIWRVSETAADLSRYYIAKDLRRGVDFELGYATYSWVDKGDSMIYTGQNMLAPDITTGDTRGYYWALEAYDEAGNRSEKSDPVYYRMLNIPRNLSVARLETNTYRLTWQYQLNPDVTPLYYTVRVYSAAWGPDSVLWYDMDVRRYGANPEPVTMSFSETNSLLIPDCTFVCQLNVIGNPLFGEEHTDSICGSAAYTTFVFQN